MHGADIDRAADRLGHGEIEAADQAAHGFADDQAERIGAEHGDDRRGVEAADDQRFQHEAERADDEGRGDHAGPDRQALGVGEIGDVGPEQDELALREIEDAHHAGDDPEPQHDQDDDRAKAQDLERRDERVSHVDR